MGLFFLLQPTHLWMMRVNSYIFHTHKRAMIVWSSWPTSKWFVPDLLSPYPKEILKGKSLVVAILPSRMVVSYCAARFFIAKPATQVWVAFPGWSYFTHPHELLSSESHSNNNVQIEPNDCSKSEGTINHLHTWQPIWPKCHFVNTGKKDQIPPF